MKLGGENKKAVYALIGCGSLAAYMVYSQFFTGPTYKPVQPPSGDIVAEAAAASDKSSGPDISRASEDAAPRPARSKTGEFRPIFISKKKEDRIANIANIDPTLRLDLLARVMKVPPAGGERDLFQILKSPPVKETVALTGPETKVHPFVGPRLPPPPPPPPPPAAAPAPPPIPLRYFGYSAVHPDGTRTAYFLDGDEILEADEGAILKGRYRIVQIGLDKVLVEDTVERRRQPINIEPEAMG
jgi:hypothetical protein